MRRGRVLAVGWPREPISYRGPGAVRRRELNLVRRAIKERWPIAPDDRLAILDRLVNVVKNTEDDRSAVAAARAVIAADSLSLAEEKQREGQNVNVNLNVAGKVALKVDELRKLPPDEFFRLYRESMGALAEG